MNQRRVQDTVENQDLLAGLQREIYERNRQKILEYERLDSPDFAEYEATYTEDIGKIESLVALKDVMSSIRKSDITLVADYHTLLLAQKTFVKISRRLRSRRVVLALEFFPQSHQADLDKYISGRIKEATLLHRVGYKARWPYEIWPHFKPICELARERGWKVVGLDGDRSRSESLQDRDDRMGKRVLEAWEEAGQGAKVLVLVGELHVARPHLPRAIKKEAKRLGRTPKLVTVLQNAQEVYHQLVGLGREQDTEFVRLGADRYCILNTPPVVVQQSYLNWIEYRVDSLDADHLKENFIHLVEQVAAAMRVPIKKDLDSLSVYGPGDEGFWEELHSLGLEDQSFGELVREIREDRSWILPSRRLVYLSNLSFNLVGDAAARLIHCLQLGLDEDAVSGFYAGIIHEAVAFFGSKVVNPRRKCKHVPYYRSVLREFDGSPPDDMSRLEAASGILLHKAFERGQKDAIITPLLKLEGRTRRRVQRGLGKILGEKLYYRFVRGGLDRKEMRKLLNFPLQDGEVAAGLYFTLVRELARVKIPRRL